MARSSRAGRPPAYGTRRACPATNASSAAYVSMRDSKAGPRSGREADPKAGPQALWRIFTSQSGGVRGIAAVHHQRERRPVGGEGDAADEQLRAVGEQGRPACPRRAEAAAQSASAVRRRPGAHQRAGLPSPGRRCSGARGPQPARGAWPVKPPRRA